MVCVVCMVCLVLMLMMMMMIVLMMMMIVLMLMVMLMPILMMMIMMMMFIRMMIFMMVMMLMMCNCGISDTVEKLGATGTKRSQLGYYISELRDSEGEDCQLVRLLLVGEALQLLVPFFAE